FVYVLLYSSYRLLSIYFKIKLDWGRSKIQFYYVPNHTSPMLLNIYSHPVRVNALNSVVSITTLELNTPSCPMFFAMTKQLTVVAEPSMTRIATNSSLRKPSITARGRNIAVNPTSFSMDAATAGF